MSPKISNFALVNIEYFHMVDNKLGIAKQITLRLIDEIGLPTVLVRVNKRKKVTLISSKFGGLPYWDKDIEYPADSKGNKLMLLAQINLEDIKGVDILPQSGILQFFVYSDNEFHYGSDFDDYANKDCFRVIYHSKIDSDISEEDVKSLNIPTSLDKFNDYDVIFGSVGLDFEISKMASPDYGEFKNKFIELADKQGYHIDNQEDVILDYLIDDWDIMGEIYDMCHNCNNHLLGYPMFIQVDPRNDEERYVKYDTLLFQMESFDEEGTDFIATWGDMGIAHFFINRNDLLSRNFDDIMYYWDCS